MEKQLKAKWIELTDSLPDIRMDFYHDLIGRYEEKNRHYHNLEHIQNLLAYTDTYKKYLSSPKTVQFAIWYHDAIYKVLKKNNELKSAELAVKQMTLMQLDEETISTCYQWILATQHHELPKPYDCFDGRFLLDIDLSILAAERPRYQQYIEQIRKEYGIFPDLLYNPGRKKVLEHFLQQERIFKTDLFYEQWEVRARENIAFELSSL